MIQTRWCKYYIVCSHCNEDPLAMLLRNETWPEVCDKCGHPRHNYTVEMVEGSWREEGYPTTEIWKAGRK